ncbi:MAG: CDGSH iron-sulfur domain-containing protein [Paracoccaceae bacterium]
MIETASIAVMKDGPLVVKNVPSLTLSDETAGQASDAMYLCRCGLSASKPFCDGSHVKSGWAE